MTELTARCRGSRMRLAIGALTALFAATLVGITGGPVGAQSNKQAHRIVSLGGDATEILYALDLQDKIVAVDSTSLEPAEALKTKANVGYMRQLSAEGVLSTGATIIVANAQAGPPEVINALKSAKIEFLSLPGNESPDNIAEKVLVVGRAFGRDTQAKALAKQIEDGLSAVAVARKKLGKPVRAIFILGVNNGRATVAGTTTSADTMIRLAGAENAASDLTGYKPLTDEALLGLQPDVILTMRRTGATQNASLISSLPGAKETPAVKAGRIVEMDGHYLLGFGPRTHMAALELMRKFYPEMTP